MRRNGDRMRSFSTEICEEISKIAPSASFEPLSMFYVVMRTDSYHKEILQQHHQRLIREQQTSIIALHTASVHLLKRPHIGEPEELHFLEEKDESRDLDVSEEMRVGPVLVVVPVKEIEVREIKAVFPVDLLLGDLVASHLLDPLAVVELLKVRRLDRGQEEESRFFQLEAVMQGFLGHHDLLLVISEKRRDVGQLH